MEKILEIKTVQSAAFRVLTEALKEILTDANFEFDNLDLKLWQWILHIQCWYI